MFHDLKTFLDEKNNPDANLKASMEFLGGLFKSKEEKNKERVDKRRIDILHILSYNGESFVKNLIQELSHERDHFKIGIDALAAHVKDKHINADKFKLCEVPGNTGLYILYEESAFKAIHQIPDYTNALKKVLQFPTTPQDSQVDELEKALDELNADKFHEEYVVGHDGSDTDMALRRPGMTYPQCHYKTDYVEKVLYSGSEILNGYAEFTRSESAMISFINKLEHGCKEATSIPCLEYIARLHQALISIVYQKANNVFIHMLYYAQDIAKQCYE